MSNPNSSAQRSFAAEPYDSVAAVLASKQITAALVGERIFTKDGYCFDVVASGGDEVTAGGAHLSIVSGNLVQSVAGRTGDVVLGVSDVSGAAALSQVIRHDEAQSLSGADQALARSNLGLGPLADMETTGSANPLTFLRGDGAWVGDDRTWQTPTRVGNTIYRNTTGRAIQVSIRGLGSESATPLQVSTDGETFVSINAITNNGTMYVGMTVDIPDGVYYRLEGTLAAGYWRELR